MEMDPAAGETETERGKRKARREEPLIPSPAVLPSLTSSNLVIMLLSSIALAQGGGGGGGSSRDLAAILIPSLHTGCRAANDTMPTAALNHYEGHIKGHRRK